MTTKKRGARSHRCSRRYELDAADALADTQFAEQLLALMRAEWPELTDAELVGKIEALGVET